MIYTNENRLMILPHDGLAVVIHGPLFCLVKKKSLPQITCLILHPM